ncbi:hypothetical protein ZIOFF_041644 [Zingiber officinale]|uniref:Histone H4 n=1 Tax=Zingiber officinale TaxID=94328 RepID=A0A8J5L5H5_ZINOF|nr:hypothetical protein ZIOFF_041644 [Zingiber officinale]
MHYTYRDGKSACGVKGCLSDIRAQIKREFRNLRQGDMFVAEYVKKFDRGCHFAPLIADNSAEKLQHFLDDLSPAIRRDVLMSDPTDYAIALRKAFRLEQTLRSQGTAKPAVKPSGSGKPQGQQASKPAMQLEKPTCQTCRCQHVGKCLLGAEVCYKCKQPNHLSFDCPQLRRPVTGRVYVMQTEEANPDTTLITRITSEGLTESLLVTIPSGEELSTASTVQNLEMVLQGHTMAVQLRPLGGEPFTFVATKNLRKPRLISFLQERKLIDSGCLSFLASITVTTTQDGPSIPNVEVVRDYADILPYDNMHWVAACARPVSLFESYMLFLGSASYSTSMSSVTPLVSSPTPVSFTLRQRPALPTTAATAPLHGTIFSQGGKDHALDLFLVAAPLHSFRASSPLQSKGGSGNVTTREGIQQGCVLWIQNSILWGLRLVLAALQSATPTPISSSLCSSIKRGCEFSEVDFQQPTLFTAIDCSIPRRCLKEGREVRGWARAERHCKMLRDNNQCITKPLVQHLARRGGVKHSSGLIYEKTRGVLKNLIHDTVTCMEHTRRKIVNAMDIVYALKRQGRTLYDFGG